MTTLLLAATLASCSGSEDPPEVPEVIDTSTAPSAPSSTTAARDLHAELDAVAAYPADAELDLRQEPAEPDEDAPTVAVADTIWVSIGTGRVRAWLVLPPATVTPPYAGLVYLHGSETDRDDFRDEAVAMAQVGVISMVLDAPFARDSSSVEPYLESYDDPGLERDLMAHTIVDVREAYDLLAARPDVDPSRLGFVGHSWGASIGVDVAAVDERPVAFALLAPRPSWTGFLSTATDDWVETQRRLVGDEAWQNYLDVLAPFDALAQIDRVDGEEVLLQYGDADDVVPPDVARELIEAAPDGTTAQTYPDAGHALDDAATAARCAWLSARLALPAVPSAALASVGLPDE